MSHSNHLFRLRTLPQTALALAACGIGSAALAQTGNPVTGATLYTRPVMFAIPLHCMDCHGPAADLARAYSVTTANAFAKVDGAIRTNRGSMGAYVNWTAQERADVAAYVATASTASPPPPFAPPPGTPVPPTASPGTVMFNSTQVGSTSATVGVQFTNSGTTAVTFATPPVVAAAGAMTDFRMASAPAGMTPCAGGTALAAGMSCSIGAQFAPTAAGTRAAIWNVNFSGGVASRQVSLQGTAVASPAPAPSPTPTPAPAPAPAPAPSAANSPAAGGGGALGAFGLAGLLALAGVAGWRRRSPR